MDETKDLTETLKVGQFVEVKLQSMVGSTGYGWELACLSEGVSLVALTTAAVPNNTVEYTFHFRGAKAGTSTAVFALARPWETGAPAKEVTYTFTVTEVTKDELKEAMNSDAFVAAPKATVKSNLSDPSQTVILYAVQPPSAANATCSPTAPQQAMPLYAVMPPYSAQPPFTAAYAVWPPLGGDLCAQAPTPQTNTLYNVWPPVATQNDACATAQPTPCQDYGVLSPNAVLPIMPYGMPTQLQANLQVQPDPRMYYAIPQPKFPQLDPRVFYGVCPPNCGTDQCCQDPTSQVQKYGTLPLMRYNFPSGNLMRYNFPNTNGCC